MAVERNNKHFLDRSVRNVEWRELIVGSNLRDRPLDVSEALADLEHFVYLLTNGWAAYDYFANVRGIDFATRFAIARERIESARGTIALADFQTLIMDTLAGVNDAHLWVIGTESRSPCASRQAWLSGVVVERNRTASPSTRPWSQARTRLTWPCVKCPQSGT